MLTLRKLPDPQETAWRLLALSLTERGWLRGAALLILLHLIGGAHVGFPRMTLNQILIRKRLGSPVQVVLPS